MIAFNKSETCSIPLTDNTDPSAPQALARFLTVAELRAYQKAWREAYESDDAQVNEASMTTMIRLAIVGTKHVIDRDGNPVTFDPTDPVASLERIATGREIWNLLTRIPVDTQLSEASKKASGSQPHSATVDSAPIAAPASV